MDDIINFNIYLWLSSKAMTNREKGGEGGNVNIWICPESRTKRAF